MCPVLTSQDVLGIISSSPVLARALLLSHFTDGVTGVREGNHLPWVTELGTAVPPVAMRYLISFRHCSSMGPMTERAHLSSQLHLRPSSLVFPMKNLSSQCRSYESDAIRS